MLLVFGVINRLVPQNNPLLFPFIKITFPILLVFLYACISISQDLGFTFHNMIYKYQAIVKISQGMGNRYNPVNITLGKYNSKLNQQEQNESKV